MRTALYLRVSTSHQKLDLQADGLRRYTTRAGLEIITEYMDVAVSGRKEGRPQLQALMRAAHHHEFACVLVWKFDRFARSVAHLLKALEEFNHLGIRFISCSDSKTSRRLRTNIALAQLTFGKNSAPVALTILENVLTRR